VTVCPSQVVLAGQLVIVVIVVTVAVLLEYGAVVLLAEVIIDADSEDEVVEGVAMDSVDDSVDDSVEDEDGEALDSGDEDDAAADDRVELEVDDSEELAGTVVIVVEVELDNSEVVVVVTLGHARTWNELANRNAAMSEGKRILISCLIVLLIGDENLS